MKLIFYAFTLCTIVTIKIGAEYGCMDTSYHLAQSGDNKDYYITTGADGGPCSCPCSQYCARYRCSLARGKCPVCNHYRIPKQFIITRKTHYSQEVPSAAIPNFKKFTFTRKQIANAKSCSHKNK